MTEQNEKLQEIGRRVLESIMEMVAALECDYDRLQELKDERQTLQDEVDGISKSADIDEDVQDKLDALAEWDEENAEEMKELIEAAGECENEEDARERIQEDPLCIEVRSGWVTSKDEMESTEYKILLGTGGPAVRIVGDLDDHNQPCTAHLETQDWFTHGKSTFPTRQAKRLC